VKNAFFSWRVRIRGVYVDSSRFSCGKTSGKVCKLKCALYGSKQSPQAWFGKFQKAMIFIGHKQNNVDDTLFVKRLAAKITILVVYVDKLLL